MKERKEEARKPLEAVNEEKLEIDIEFFFPSELKFPVRPPWDFSMSKEQLDAKENKYFSVCITFFRNNVDFLKNYCYKLGCNSKTTKWLCSMSYPLLFFYHIKSAFLGSRFSFPIILLLRF